MRDLLQDVAYFWRALLKAPGFFAVAVLTLALGIGANTAIFSVINSVLLRPLPFHEPERLVRLFQTELAPGNYPFTGPDYLDWREQNKTLESTALFTYFRPMNVSGGGGAESAIGIRAEATFFDVLGVRPLIGRTFAKGEDAAPGARVAVISYGFWQRHFGADRGVVNKSVELDSERYTIVGVMPSWFNYPRNVELWTPLDMSPQNLGSRGSHSHSALARLKPGVTVPQALADLKVIAARLEEQYPDTNEKVGAAVVPMKEQLTGASREPLLILLGAVALVLLVACANVANLLLIRAGSRRREVAIRSALGAGRGRIVRQLLTESVLLAIVGGGAGLAAAWWGVRLLRSVKSLPVPLVNPIAIDRQVLLFTLGAAVVTGLLFGILPALHASAMRPADELKSGGRAVPGARRRSFGLRDGIAIAEIALSLALLVGAGLLLRSFDKMRSAEIGADTQNVVTMGINLPAAKYPTLVSRRAFYDRLLERVRSTPGVRAAGVSTLIPLEGGSNGYITVPGQDDDRLKNQLFEWNYVSGDYFRTYGVALRRGRVFTAQDEDQAAVVTQKITDVFSSPNPDRALLRGLAWPAIINETMARLIWGKQDAVGRSFVLGGFIDARVIGVVADVKVRGVRDGDLPQGYFPFVGALDDAGMRQLTLKTTASPMALLGQVRGHLSALDSSLALVDPRTMEDVIADGMAATSLQTWLLGAFAVLAVLLAAVGLYSVMAFLVAQRRQEIGIRMALGAGRGDLLRLVVGHATKLIAVGVAAGLCAALWLSRLLRGLLFGVQANDVWTIAVVSALLVLVGLVACALPARRAMRIDPIVALRYE